MNDLVRIVESNEAEIKAAFAAADVLGEQIMGGIYSPEMVRRLVDSGRCRTNTVLDGANVPAYVVVYGFDEDNWLCVHGLFALKASDFGLAEKAVCQLARSNGCPVVQGTILRSGMVRFVEKSGWKPIGVVVTKKL